MNDNDKASSHELAAMKVDFIEKISAEAEWRDRKAIEYPHDSRNAQSAGALRKLADNLEELPPNDPHWVALWRVYETDDPNLRISEAESEVLRGHGFHNDQENDEAVAFLDHLVSELTQALLDDMPESNDGQMH